jgi:hypothetical protein
MSQAEKDRLVKERIKQERRDQFKAKSSMRQSTMSGLFEEMVDEDQPMSQEEKDRLANERIKQERRDQLKEASSMKQSAIPALQHVKSQNNNPESSLDMTSLKVGDDSKDKGDKRQSRKKIAASLRTSTWFGLYDEMVSDQLQDELEAGNVTSATPPRPEEGSYKESSSIKHRAIKQDFQSSIESYQISDDVDEEECAEKEDAEKHRKSKHRHHKKSHRHDHSHRKSEEGDEKSSRHRLAESTTSGTSEKPKSRHHRHTEIPGSTTSEKSKSRRSKQTEEDDSKNSGEKSKSRRHRRVTLLTSGEGDDELSKRIEEKLRERECRKKKKKKPTRDGLEESQNTLGASTASNNDDGFSGDELDQDRRE